MDPCNKVPICFCEKQSRNIINSVNRLLLFRLYLFPHNAPPPSYPPLPPPYPPPPNHPPSILHLNAPSTCAVLIFSSELQHHSLYTRRRSQQQRQREKNRSSHHLNPLPSPTPQDTATITVLAFKGAQALDDS